MREAAGLDFEPVQTFGASYARTLAEWRQRFHAAWPAIEALGFDERFRRMWDYYLAYCQAGFERGTDRCRHLPPAQTASATSSTAAAATRSDHDRSAAHGQRYDSDRAGAPFELTTFLDGRTKAWGMFEDRFGRLRRRFEVDMHGRWQEGVFLLDERFVYDDGRVEQRTWLVKPLSDGPVRGHLRRLRRRGAWRVRSTTWSGCPTRSGSSCRHAS